MKRLAINLVAVLVIGLGGLTFTPTAPAHTATTQSMMAECEQGDIVVEGDTCKVNEQGNCECTDK